MLLRRPPLRPPHTHLSLRPVATISASRVVGGRAGEAPPTVPCPPGGVTTPPTRTAQRTGEEGGGEAGTPPPSLATPPTRRRWRRRPPRRPVSSRAAAVEQRRYAVPQPPPLLPPLLMVLMRRGTRGRESLRPLLPPSGGVRGPPRRRQGKQPARWPWCASRGLSSLPGRPSPRSSRTLR